MRHNREVVLVASLATNIVLAGDRELPQDITETAIAVIAERILTRMLPVRAIISPAHLVEMLWLRLRTRLDPPTVVRMNQPVYAIRGRLDYPDLKESRYATTRDLESLIPACAAMHARRSASIRWSATRPDIANGSASWSSRSVP